MIRESESTRLYYTSLFRVLTSSSSVLFWVRGGASGEGSSINAKPTADKEYKVI